MTNNGDKRPSPEAFLTKLKEGERARLRVYIGAAPGVGKTFQMLEEAHLLKKQGVDVVVAFVETHNRAETSAMLGDLEVVPLRQIEYRGVTLKEMDLDAVIARAPEIAIVRAVADQVFIPFAVPKSLVLEKEIVKFFPVAGLKKGIALNQGMLILEFLDHFDVIRTAGTV